jgi:beta-galactosidase/beta-glucuronidase
VRVLAAGTEVGGAEVTLGRPTRIALSAVRPWSPEDPFLHDVEVVLGEDLVRSQVGMRSFGVGRDGSGTPRLLLNGEPYLHVGVLDQGYWSDGLMTPPSDEAMVHDIATMRRLGFSVLRKHVKVEPLRWYHHCDRLGMLVWQDLVNGGGRYRTAAVTWPGRWPVRNVRLRDDRRWVQRLLGRDDPAAQQEFRDELRRTVTHLRSVTSLAVWVPFNEGWGQFDAVAVAEELRADDPTRVVNHASGWHDQGGGDLWSTHVYRRRFRVPRRRRGDPRPLVLSEYGGYDLGVDGHTFDDHEFGYRHFDTAEELAAGFAQLHAELEETVPRGLSATVYTQLADVEEELNGLLTYDREVLKIPEAVIRSALDAVRAALSPSRPGGG